MLIWHLNMCHIGRRLNATIDSIRSISGKFLYLIRTLIINSIVTMQNRLFVHILFKVDHSDTSQPGFSDNMQYDFEMRQIDKYWFGK